MTMGKTLFANLFCSRKVNLFRFDRMYLGGEGGGEITIGPTRK